MNKRNRSLAPLILLLVYSLIASSAAAQPKAGGLLSPSFEALIKNASSGIEECLIFGNNGADLYPSRFNWGPGPFCGFPGGKSGLLANGQAVWQFVPVGPNLFAITHAGDGLEECLIFNNGGTDLHPSRFLWAIGPYCGFPGGLGPFLANGQGVFKLTELASGKYMIENSSDGEEKCLIFDQNGAGVFPVRFDWGPGDFCGFPGGKPALLANGQAVWTIEVLN